MLKTVRNNWLSIDTIHLTCDHVGCDRAYSTELPDRIYSQSDERLRIFYRTLAARGWASNLQTKRAFCPQHAGIADQLDRYYRQEPRSGHQRMVEQQYLAEAQQDRARTFSIPTYGGPGQLQQYQSWIKVGLTNNEALKESGLAKPASVPAQGWTRGHNWSYPVCSGSSFASLSAHSSSSLSSSPPASPQ